MLTGTPPAFITAGGSKFLTTTVTSATVAAALASHKAITRRDMFFWASQGSFVPLRAKTKRTPEVSTCVSAPPTGEARGASRGATKKPREAQSAVNAPRGLEDVARHTLLCIS